MRKSFVVLGVCAVLIGFGTYSLPVRARQTAPPVIAAPKAIITPDTKANRDLCDALLKGDVAKTKAALSAGADPEALVRFNWISTKQPATPLFFCDASGNNVTRELRVSLLRLLIAHLKNANLRDERKGQTALMAAVALGDLPTIQSLVERGANVNAVTVEAEGVNLLTYEAETALYQAMIHGQGHTEGYDLDPVISYLLEHGANVDYQATNGSTALMEAARFGQISTVRLLLSKGANASLRNAQGYTALNLASFGRSEKIVALLKDRTEINLWEAAAAGKVARVKELLAAGANPNEPSPVFPEYSHLQLPPPIGEQPLACAAKSGDVETVKALLAAGADAKCVHPRTGITALHEAAAHGANAVIPLLLAAGADINANASAAMMSKENRPETYQYVKTPLILAVDAANAETVALLLKNGVVASKHRQADVALEHLIWRRPEQEPNRSDELHADRVLRDKREAETQTVILDYLLGAGADMTKTGAVLIAVRGNRPDMLGRLLKRGGSPNAHHVFPGDFDDTALNAAIAEFAQGGHDEVTPENESDEDASEYDENDKRNTTKRCLAILLEAGAKVNEAAHRSGKTPLMTAAEFAQPALIADLIKRGADINATDSGGGTALLRVASKGEDVSILRFLLRNGAKINHADKNGYTALMLAIDNGENAAWEMLQKKSDEDIAAYRERMKTIHDAGGDVPTPPNETGHPKMVEALLRAGADKTIVAKDGQTALSLAERNGFKSVIAMLTAPPPKR